MAHFHVKKKNGRPYLYVREIARVDGKPKVVSQVYIGSPDKVAALAKGTVKGKNPLNRYKVEEYGSLWLAHQMDQGIDLAGIIDDIIPRDPKEKGPSVGEFFLYGVLNRMVAPTSKNAMAEWYQRTAIQQIRPVDTKQLTSQRFWEKWNRVSEEQLTTIANRFFAKMLKVEPSKAEGILFDTTNYYTFMSSKTESELSQRGKSKVGRDSLRQIGVSLLVDRANRMPLWYRLYPGNLHDSTLFGGIMDEMFGAVCGLTDAEELTVVVDKGMNSPENYTWIDAKEHLHFVTTYSTYFEQELARTPLSEFSLLDTEKNRLLSASDREHDRVLGYRTTGEYWGRERTVVVTHNPVTARKKMYSLESKLVRLKAELEIMKGKVISYAPQWRNEAVIRERYEALCKKLHLPSALYKLDIVTTTDGGLAMWYSKQSAQVTLHSAAFGRNIIITDHHDWTVEQIAEASNDRWKVESQFRLSKTNAMVGLQPVRHWTDSKIRCHVFTCIVAMAYLRRLELIFERANVSMAAPAAMAEMRVLNSVLNLANIADPVRELEQHTKTQELIIATLGYKVSDGVLQLDST